MLRPLCLSLCLAFALAGPVAMPAYAQDEAKGEEAKGKGGGADVSPITYILAFAGIIVTLVVVSYPNRK